MLDSTEGNEEMHEKLLDESERSSVGYMWKPWVFSIGDQCLFLPPESHRQVWEDMSELYSQPGVILKRTRGVSYSSVDDEYDVIFNINNTATVVTELPGVYLQKMGSS